MKRSIVIRSAAITSAVVFVCGAWALVHAQTAPAGKRGAQEAGQSSDAAGDLRRFPGATTSARPQPRGQSDNALFRSMMSGTSALVMSPAEDDPEMAKLAETEGELAHSSEELLGQYANAEKPDDQKRLKADLREALAKQFDVQRQRRELELARVEDRIKKVREQLKKRNEARETIVDRRLDQLINDAEGLGWAAPAGASARSAGTDHYPRLIPNQPATTPAGRN